MKDENNNNNNNLQITDILFLVEEKSKTFKISYFTISSNILTVIEFGVLSTS